MPRRHLILALAAVVVLVAATLVLTTPPPQSQPSSPTDVGEEQEATPPSPRDTPSGTPPEDNQARQGGGAGEGGKGGNVKPGFVREGDVAPDFVLHTVDGEVFRLSDQRGRVVVLEFMATWCPYCRRMMPALVDLWREYGDRVVFVSASIDPRDTGERLGRYARQFDAGWVWLVGARDVSLAYGVPGVPTVFVIDGEGRVTWVGIGYHGKGELRRAIERALGG